MQVIVIFHATFIFLLYLFGHRVNKPLISFIFSPSTAFHFIKCDRNKSEVTVLAWHFVLNGVSLIALQLQSRMLQT